jgi:glutathionyl-hydroquinone reductase
VTGQIVNNESADILRMMSTGFGEVASDDVDLVPGAHVDEINMLNKLTSERFNNAVYRAGFGRDQGKYEAIVTELFETLDALDARLSDRRYPFGDRPVETDWRLFTPLVRADRGISPALLPHSCVEQSVRRDGDDARRGRLQRPARAGAPATLRRERTVRSL